MSTESQRALVGLLEELDRIPGVRGSIIATVEGAFQARERGAFDMATATDIAKTVRRMVVASATVGSPIDELLITFGSARMMIVPIREEAILTIMLERDSATPQVRSAIAARVGGLRQTLTGPGPGESSVTSPVAAEPEDEVERLLTGDLGPVLRDVHNVFANFLARSGRTNEDASHHMREQMREWLLCCNPSPYTFPLLIEGLAQLIYDHRGERAAFTEEVQAAMRNSKVWASKR